MARVPSKTILSKNIEVVNNKDIDEPFLVFGDKGEVNKARADTNKKVSEKQARIREYRKEASRMAATANKRVQRLEDKGLQDNPAYKGYMQSGGGKFSVKGKSHNELQSEVARMNAFLNATTSTIRGTNNYLKTIAKNTGIKYKTMAELRGKAAKFFELASKVEQYLRQLDDMASAVGYQKIWEAVNTYVKDANVDLNSGKNDIDSMIRSITDALQEFDKPEPIKANASARWFTLKRK